jgi:hypothetical protein
MIPQSCLLIETTKFPILEGEKEGLVNEGMYGKAFCLYLQARLPLAGIEVPFFCNEDWGWWLHTERNGFRMGLCIYSDPEAHPHPERYALLPSIQAARTWSWSKFRWIDQTQDVMAIVGALEMIFTADGDIPTVTRHDDDPF